MNANGPDEAGPLSKSCQNPTKGFLAPLNCRGKNILPTLSDQMKSREIAHDLAFGEVQSLMLTHVKLGLLPTDEVSVRFVKERLGVEQSASTDPGGAAFDTLLELRRRGRLVRRQLDLVEGLHGPDAAIEFRALDPAGKATARSLTWVTGTDRTAIADWLHAQDGKRNIYVGVNPRVTALAGSTTPASEHHVASRNFVVFDHDNKDAAPGDPEWKNRVQQLRDLDPIMQVKSGNGVHTWFAIEPAMMPGAAPATAALNAMLRDAGSDPVADLPRIIRLPWSINIPSPKKRERGARLALAAVTLGPQVNPRQYTTEELTQRVRDKIGSVAPAASPVPSNDKSDLRAPDLALFRDAVDLIPNTEHVGRDFQTNMAHAFRGAVAGTDFEPEGREIFLEWSARYPGADPDHDAQLYDTIRSTKRGWPHILADLATVNPKGHKQVMERLVPFQAEAARKAFQDQPIDLAQVSDPTTPTEARQQRETALASLMAELNEQYCLVQDINGVVDRKPGSGKLYGVVSSQQFALFHNGRFQTGKSGRNSTGLATLWLNDPQTPRYGRAGLWRIGREPAGALNLFDGLPKLSQRQYAVGPAQGVKPSCAKVLDFILAVICSGDTKLNDYVLNWMAWKVQNPLEKPGVNLVLIGKQGTGKGTLGKMMLDIFGRKYALHVTQADHLLGRFTGHLDGALFVLIDEALFGKDPRTAGIYKARTTEETILIEHKGQTPRTAINHMAIMILSNSLAAAPVEANDRRSTVIDVSDAHRQDTTFFGALWHEWDHGGREAFIEFLTTRDLSRFNPKSPFATDAKAAMAAATADPVTAWWLDVLASGNLPSLPNSNGSVPDWSTETVTVPTSELNSAFDLWARDKRIAHRTSPAEVQRTLNELCPVRRKCRPRVGGRQEWSYTYPSLNECRAAANRALGGSASNATPGGAATQVDHPGMHVDQSPPSADVKPVDRQDQQGTPPDRGNTQQSQPLTLC